MSSPCLLAEFAFARELDRVTSEREIKSMYDPVQINLCSTEIRLFCRCYEISALRRLRFSGIRQLDRADLFLGLSICRSHIPEVRTRVQTLGIPGRPNLTSCHQAQADSYRLHGGSSARCRQFHCEEACLAGRILTDECDLAVPGSVSSQYIGGFNSVPDGLSR